MPNPNANPNPNPNPNVPAEPEEEGADELERGGVPIEVPGAFEAAVPRAEHLCAHLW